MNDDEDGDTDITSHTSSARCLTNREGDRSTRGGLFVSPFLLRASCRYSEGEGQWEGKENENENEEAVDLLSDIHHLSSR